MGPDQFITGLIKDNWGAVWMIWLLQIFGDIEDNMFEYNVTTIEQLIWTCIHEPNEIAKALLALVISKNIYLFMYLFILFCT